MALADEPGRAGVWALALSCVASLPSVVVVNRAVSDALWLPSTVDIESSTVS